MTSCRKFWLKHEEAAAAHDAGREKIERGIVNLMAAVGIGSLLYASCISGAVG